jgi:hypothetical protein
LSRKLWTFTLEPLAYCVWVVQEDQSRIIPRCSFQKTCSTSTF